MYCGNCGKELLENAKFCQYCGTVQNEEANQKAVSTTQQINNYKNIDKVENPSDNRPANTLCTISLCLYFGGPILTVLLYIIRYVIFSTSAMLSGVVAMLGGLSSFSTLAAYVLMIVARIKYPTSKYAKVVMWIYIILLILEIIGVIILAVACGWYAGETCSQLGNMG